MWQKPKIFFGLAAGAAKTKTEEARDVVRVLVWGVAVAKRRRSC